MPQRRVTVASKVGLHARPAASFVRAATRQPVPVFIAKSGNDPVPATSMLSVLGLAVGHGDAVVISADGEGADAALDELAAMLASETD